MDRIIVALIISMFFLKRGERKSSNFQRREPCSENVAGILPDNNTSESVIFKELFYKKAAVLITF